VSAIEETRPAAPGKSTHDSGQLSVDDATRATLPHLRYADAVDAAFQDLRFLPDALEMGLRREPGAGGRELFLRLEWLPGHDDLVPPGMQADGLTVEWSHLVGWLVRSGDELVVPDVDQLADPAAIAGVAMHSALHGLRCACDKPEASARWTDAVYLDIALTRYDERTEGASV
jgi:hypothetical protein